MDTQNPSAPPRAQARIGGKQPRSRPRGGGHSSGVVHENIRHTARFTVIGNHLAQHAELSLLAIGLAVHIQSLPAGARVDIKTLAARFPEGATRIADALRELETHGYLRRRRERIPGGHLITRTVSCNHPAAARHHTTEPDCPPPDDPTAAPQAPTPVPVQALPEHESHPPQAAAHATSAPQPPQGTHPPRRPRTPRKPLPAVPQPGYPAPALLRAAADLLTGLRNHDHRLLLSACDTAHLAPGVAAWLERDVTPTAVRHALTRDLPPEGPRRPAALLAHRLAAQLPPPPPFRAPAPPPAPARHPLQNCDACDHAFRAPQPGTCGPCTAAAIRTPGNP